MYRDVQGTHTLTTRICKCTIRTHPHIHPDPQHTHTHTLPHTPASLGWLLHVGYAYHEVQSSYEVTTPSPQPCAPSHPVGGWFCCVLGVVLLCTCVCVGGCVCCVHLGMHAGVHEYCHVHTNVIKAKHTTTTYIPNMLTIQTFTCTIPQ